MFISELRIENFRMFGEGNEEFVLPLEPGLTALVGENDNGKTAVIDALRLVLGTRDQESFRIRLLLEKLDLEVRDGGTTDARPNRGLGSNNLLFMACELLLLAEDEGFPVLLIEEPEAHLHPQRQLRLMQFLQQKADEKRDDGKRIQIIVTTHSPNLASVIDLRNLVLLHGGQAFPLGEPHTKLDRADYGFLRRFLDVTKANLFFARGLFIVEGDAENIVIPTIARLLDRDLTDHGISILNVGGVGLRRYAKIYQRKRSKDPRTIDLPVACLADIDVMLRSRHHRKR